MTIKLIAGLRNIGLNYINTRHNFGAEYIKLLSKKYGVVLRENKNLYGYIGQLKLSNNNIIQLLIPNSYINESGLSISACANTYQLCPEEILIAHDDLDLSPGKIRIKLGSKSNDSHHGLQNIIIKLKNKFNFYRLRIGIGRPVDKNKVVDFVLTRPSIYEQNIINDVIYEAIRHTENIVSKNFIQVMNKLHFYNGNLLRNK